eukprot:gnl/TRDRNA2_/TRDRNA2_128733_c1_seq1.p1 gnl/TRDRNA2_/TRDRNA2_128733_c1~~gnl/TRDRNA2_/TRDRNA2_128733_c1_seq1.p1  ORF type:complete len:123 (+),score=4.39 gnl/TRDRNA2_/TRDRNA2_128733_c1_seq1:111-479(+)
MQEQDERTHSTETKKVAFQCSGDCLPSSQVLLRTSNCDLETRVRRIIIFYQPLRGANLAEQIVNLSARFASGQEQVEGGRISDTHRSKVYQKARKATPPVTTCSIEPLPLLFFLCQKCGTFE